MHRYLQQVALVFAFSMLLVWVVLGWDSGVGILENWFTVFPQLLTGEMSLGEFIDVGYKVYGRTFHFSSYVIYALLYVAVSQHLESLGLVKSLNVFASAGLVVLNVTVFELWYMGCFAVFQMNRRLIEWFTSDILFLQQYLGFLGFGLWGVLAVYTISRNNFHSSFRVSPRSILVLLTLFYSALFWIYYPFPVETVTLQDWTSSTLFPQTHYAYVNSEIYVANDLLHLVNVVVKALFALAQFSLLKDLKNAK
jgi:hypothetical protein